MKNTRPVPAAIATAAALVFLFAGFTCRQKSASPVIARVGGAILTLDDLNAGIPPQYSDRIGREEHINYVKQWIDRELLYHEAVRQRLHRDAAIRERLEKMKKDLLTADLISRNALSSDRIRITEEMVAQYYEKNTAQFKREKAAIKCMQIVVDGAAEAWRIRNQLTPENFAAMAAAHSNAPAENPESLPYIALSDLPPEISQVAAALRIRGISSPVKSAIGHHILFILDKQPEGSTADIGEVRDEIINRLSTDIQKQEIGRLLSALRLKTEVEFHFELIPSTGGRAAADTLM